MKSENSISVVMIRLREVTRVTGLARSTIYKLIGEGSFPRPVRLAARAVAWRSDVVNAWIEQCIEKSNNSTREVA